MGRSYGKRWPAIVLGSAGVVLGCVAAVWSAQPGGPGDVKVVFPPEHAVLLSGTLQVIARGALGDLQVDGQTRPWEPFEPSLGVAKIGVSPGRHEVRIGDRKVDFVVGLSAEEHDGPKQWEVFRFHPIKNDQTRCAGCHETRQQNGRTAVGDLKPTKSCFECHKSVDVEAKHSHPMQPLENCHSCHAMHGSSRQSSLRAPVKQLCSECHES